MFGNLSGRVFSKRNVLFFLIIANLFGFFVGMVAYYPQLRETPFYLWLVVVDCPIAVFLFAVLCTLLYLRVEVPDVLEFFTSVCLIKFGIWTLLVMILYWNYYMENEILGMMIFVLHLGMVLEGLILIPRISPSTYNTGVILFLLLINDLFDYFFGTRPVIPPEHTWFLMFESFGATVFITSAVFLWHRR